MHNCTFRRQCSQTICLDHIWLTSTFLDHAFRIVVEVHHQWVCSSFTLAQDLYFICGSITTNVRSVDVSVVFAELQAHKNWHNLEAEPIPLILRLELGSVNQASHVAHVTGLLMERSSAAPWMGLAGNRQISPPSTQWGKWLLPHWNTVSYYFGLEAPRAECENGGLCTGYFLEQQRKRASSP